MKTQYRLSLIIPCFNEEASLKHCVERTLLIATDQIGLEVIIVDDCSTDRSLEIARALEVEYTSVRVISHEKNAGKGAALRSGFSFATGDFVGIQDADLEYDPWDYHKLLQPILEDRADVVFGSRYLQVDDRRILYFWHSWMNRWLTTLSNMFTDLDITDMETCYKLFRREIIQQIDLKENRFGFEPEVTAKVAQLRCRVYECAIGYRPRTPEEGKKITWKDGIRAVYCILHYGAPRAPLPMQLIMYFVIGATCGAANIAVFGILSGFGAGITTAVVVAFLSAAALNYLLSIAILFRHKARWNTAGELLAYVASITIMGVIDYGVTMFFLFAGASALTSKAIATAIGFVGNFLLRRFFVFPLPRVTRI